MNDFVNRTNLRATLTCGMLVRILEIFLTDTCTFSQPLALQITYTTNCKVVFSFFFISPGESSNKKWPYFVISQGGSYATPLRALFSLLLTQIAEATICKLWRFIGFPLRHIFKSLIFVCIRRSNFPLLHLWLNDFTVIKGLSLLPVSISLH